MLIHIATTALLGMRAAARVEAALRAHVVDRAECRALLAALSGIEQGPAACLASRRSIASRLSGRPVPLGKSAAPGRPARSANQAPSTASA